MNEISQQIRFFKSRLNWDADVSVLGEGESRNFLNTVPEESVGARTNCPGTTQKVSLISIASTTSITVTTTEPSTGLKKLQFALSTVPQYLWIELTLNSQLKHIYILGSGYSTVADFITHVISEVRRLFSGSIYSYGTITNGCYFEFEYTDSTSMIVRTGSTSTYPSNLKVVGTHYSDVDDVSYFWVYDSTSTHSLYQYVNYNDILIELPINAEISKYTQVLGAFTIGTGVDTLLYWAYRDKTIHKINVYKCLTSAISFTEDSTNILKPPPFSTLTFAQTVSTAYNNYNQYFQLLVRNKFVDGEASVFGTLSPLLYPSSYGENSIGYHGGTSNKKYDFSISNWSHNEWDEFEYALKTGEGEWQMVDLKASTSGYTKEVTGSDVTSTAAPSDIHRLFDYIPQKAGSIQALNNNRLAIADCTEGYDNTEPTATITTVYPTVSSIDTYYVSDAGDDASFLMSNPSSTYFATHCIYMSTPVNEYLIYLPDDTGMTAAQIAAFFSNHINTHIVPVDTNIASASTSSATLSINSETSLLVSKYIVFRGANKYRSFAPGTTHYLGIVYYDKFGRCGGVNISDSLAHSIPSAQAMAYLTMSLSSQPPEWAYYYKIFYGGSRKVKYQQMSIRAVDIQPKENNTAIYINNGILAAQDVNDAFSMGTYSFTPGDRIRLLQYSTVSTSSGLTYTEGTGFTTIIDREILYQDEAAIYIANVHDATVISQMAASSHYLVEVYTPNESNPVEYLETPHWGTISNPGTTSRYHNYFYGANSSYTRQNQTASVPMIGTLEGFDHVIHQTFQIDSGVPVTFWILSESISNYFPSKTKGLGRVNFYSPDFKKLRRNIVRASNVYLPKTNINGLSTFEYANEVIVDETYGPITDIQLSGDVLKIIQPHKLSSIYLGAQLATDANGNSVSLNSDRILTEPRYGAMKFGSIHPESIVTHGGYMYMFDAINSCVVRDNPGGTFAISDNGMRTYFKEKTQALVDSCGYSFKVYGGYDYQNELYLLTFSNPYDSTMDATIGFHEPSESWYSFYSFIPEAYLSIPGSYMMTFKDGYAYLHDSATRNNFHGTQYSSEVTVVSNEAQGIPKKFNSIAVQSNDQWTAGTIGDIVVDADMIIHQDPKNYTWHKGAMESVLKSFRYYNGEYVSQFLRNAKTSSSTFSPIDLLNGRPLVGETLTITLRNSNTQTVYMRGVRINSQMAK